MKLGLAPHAKYKAAENFMPKRQRDISERDMLQGLASINIREESEIATSAKPKYNYVMVLS